MLLSDFIDSALFKWFRNRFFVCRGKILFYVLLHLPELPESVPYGKAVRREHHTILCKFPDCVQTAVPFLSDVHSHQGYPRKCEIQNCKRILVLHQEIMISLFYRSGKQRTFDVASIDKIVFVIPVSAVNHRFSNIAGKEKYSPL